MNETIHTYIKKAGDGVSLTHEERDRMRRTIHAYMEMKPLRAPARPVAVAWSMQWVFAPRSIAAVLIVGLFASSGGVSYAAQSALPGDLLYPIKTRVNEPLAGTLAVTASAKTAWAMDVASERVKEAATLAASGRLSSTTQEQLQANFEEHAQVAEQAITAQASSSPDDGSEAAVRFEARLSEYENVLTQVGLAQRVDVGALAASINAHASHVAKLSRKQGEDGNAAASVPARIEHIRAAAQGQLDVSTALSDAADGSISPSSAQLVAIQLKNASDTISAVDVTNGNHMKAATLEKLQRALSSTEKLGVFLETSAAIHARTGLVVGEPDGVGEATSTPFKKPARATRDRGDRSERTNAAPKDATITPQGTSAAGSAPAAAPTNASENVSTGNSAPTVQSVSRDGDGEDHTSRPRLLSLPVSVPLGD